jgi:hypothetical protein
MRSGENMFAEIAMKQGSSKHLTLAAMSLGYGVVQLDVTIVNLAINSSVPCTAENQAGDHLHRSHPAIHRSGRRPGLLVPPLTSMLLGSVDKSRSGIGPGVLNSMRQIGSVLGVALFGSMMGAHGLLPGMHVSLTISLVLLVASAPLIIDRKETAAERR